MSVYEVKVVRTVAEFYDVVASNEEEASARALAQVKVDLTISETLESTVESVEFLFDENEYDWDEVDTYEDDDPDVIHRYID